MAGLGILTDLLTPPDSAICTGFAATSHFVTPSFSGGGLSLLLAQAASMASQPGHEDSKAMEVVDIAGSGDKSPPSVTVLEMTEDEHHLARLGYRQTFIRAFGMFESWAATFVSELSRT